ncbi:MAG TPA: DUF1990 family protein [Solirubrobacterales bacterium]|nr:DUF1990 family protein [Solirubrobacterales bacterium]
MYRDEIEGSIAEDLPPPPPEHVSLDGVQVVEDGTGPLFHRRYRARIRESVVGPAELVALVAAEPNRVAPSEFATFRRADGEEEPMRVGDDYVVRMAGPWDGPVRVASMGDAAFRLLTLEGHLEVGQIEFRARRDRDRLIFEIESWARSKDSLTDLLYARLRMSKEVQLHMWASTLEGIVGLSGGKLERGLEIRTRTVSEACLDE